MKASEAQRAGVLGWIEKWRPRLFLHHYQLIPIWRATPKRDDTPQAETRAMATMDDAGLVAHIEFYPPFWKLTAEMQERTLIHELMHVVAEGATEDQVNRLTEIVWLAYQGAA